MEKGSRLRSDPCMSDSERVLRRPVSDMATCAHIHTSRFPAKLLFPLRNSGNRDAQAIYTLVFEQPDVAKVNHVTRERRSEQLCGDRAGTRSERWRFATRPL